MGVGDRVLKPMKTRWDWGLGVVGIEEDGSVGFVSMRNGPLELDERQ